MIEKSSNLSEVAISYKTKVKAADRQKIFSSKNTADILREVFNPDRIEHVEEFIILLLNRANHVLGWAKISQGGGAGTVVDQKVIFQIAINANAHNIILSHNHPSGNLKPSEADIILTKKVRDGCELLDIQLLDHLILTAESSFSFADEGLI